MLMLGKALTAVALVVAAVTLMVVSTTEHNPQLARWAILVGMAGCTTLVTLALDGVVHHAIAAERRRTERLIEQVAANFAERERERPLRKVPDQEQH